GSLSRFNTSRGLPDFIKTYNEEKLYKSYNLEIVGGNQEEIKELIKVFDRHWDGRITRKRDVFEIIQQI
ncbi:MAG: hypothetical protein QGH07_09225, partial [Alphaproteobacteria bacterium]|nr:hypothetical protein [Alphaproteobacteria bacterium]